MKNILILTILSLSIFLFSCEKDEGEGGMGSIGGYVFIQDYNFDFTILRDTYPAQDYDVYIFYGDNKYPDDKIETSYDGYFEFNYLREGNYIIFAYSKNKELDYNVTSELIPVIDTVKISSRKEKIIVDTLFVVK